MPNNIAKLINHIKNNDHYQGAGIALFTKINGEFAILLHERSEHVKDSHKWSIPGGTFSQSSDKSLEDTAYREFKEETLFDIRKMKAQYLGEWLIDIPVFSYKILFYYTDEVIPTTFDNYEVLQAKVISFSQLKDYQLHFLVNEEIRKFNGLKGNIL